MDDNNKWKIKRFNYPYITMEQGATCIMKFADDLLGIVVNSTTMATLKINSMRTPKNYLIPVTTKLVRN